jgi:hypothetical protein
MPTKTSVGPNEVVRLEVLRLAPPLELLAHFKAANARRALFFCAGVSASACH